MNNYQYLEATVRDTLVRVIWSHKTHEKQADIYSINFFWMETAKIVAVSLTSAGILSLLFTDEWWVKLASAILSLVSLFVNAFFKSFDLKALIREHKKSAIALLTIRDRLTVLIMKVKMRTESSEDLSSQYDEILIQLHKVYSEAPITSNKALDRAKEALNVKQDNTFSDDEINSFLPIELRKVD